MLKVLRHGGFELTSEKYNFHLCMYSTAVLFKLGNITANCFSDYVDGDTYFNFKFFNTKVVIFGHTLYIGYKRIGDFAPWLTPLDNWVFETSYDDDIEA